MPEAKYIHDANIHRAADAQRIVPLIIDLFHPASVLDVGCGLGSFIREFQESGVHDVIGVEGEWLNKNQLVIDSGLVRIHDLESPLELGRRFDVALCLEVAEHLKPEAAQLLITTLTRHSDVVVFSAAIPFQGGQNHINEQWLEYWRDLFAQRDYQLYDLIRPRIWNDRDIYWWYRQNIVVCIRSSAPHQFERAPVNNYVHPELYLSKVSMAQHYKEWVDKIFAGDIDVEVAEQILKNTIQKQKEKENGENEKEKEKE